MTAQNPAPQVASRIILREYNGIVLCYLPNNSVTPFVVWRRDAGDPNYFFGGTYCRFLTEACESFYERSGTTA